MTNTFLYSTHIMYAVPIVKRWRKIWRGNWHVAKKLVCQVRSPFWGALYSFHHTGYTNSSIDVCIINLVTYRIKEAEIGQKSYIILSQGQNRRWTKTITTPVFLPIMYYNFIICPFVTCFIITRYTNHSRFIAYYNIIAFNSV